MSAIRYVTETISKRIHEQDKKIKEEKQSSIIETSIIETSIIETSNRVESDTSVTNGTAFIEDKLNKLDIVSTVNSEDDRYYLMGTYGLFCIWI